MASIVGASPIYNNKTIIIMNDQEIMTIEETTLTNSSLSVKAVCVNNIDLERMHGYEELQINKVYTPDYMMIGRSRSYLYIREFPGKKYNTVMFEYYEADGRKINFNKDITYPIMERYRDYLNHEMILTGTWEVYVKMNDNPINTVPSKDTFRIIQYRSYILEHIRTSPQDD